MMDNMDEKTLMDVLQYSNSPCISIYIPTLRKAQIEQNAIRYKKLLHKAEQELKTQGFREKEYEKWLEPANELVDDLPFWSHQEDGLAVFISKDRFDTYRTKIPFDEHLVISNRFYIKPLLPLFQDPKHCYVLAIGHEQTSVFVCKAYGLQKLEIAGLPQSFEEAMAYEDPEKSVQYHTGTGSESKGGRRRAMFHGQGVGTDDKEHKKDVLRYFQMIDNHITDHLNEDKKPLFLVGQEHLIGLYREANSYPNLLEKTLPINPQDLSETELFDRVKEKLGDFFNHARDEALQKYDELKHTEKTSLDIKEIFKASQTNRIETLFLAKGKKRWGKFDPEDYKVTLADEPDKDHIDLTDLAAAQTLQHNGQALLLDPDQMPEQSDMAAIFRY